jgi:hypothetical protein
MFDIYNYTNQTDLFSVGIGFVGALIGGLLSYLGVYHVHKNQLKNESKNIAKAIELDLQTIKENKYFSTAYFFYTKNPTTVSDIISELEPHIPPYQLYNKETGLYLLYKHEINKLNYDLAKKVYEFYNKLFTAENHRLLLIQNQNFNLNILNTPEKNPISLIDFECLFKYPEMTDLIVECWGSIQNLIDELEKISK